jgi:hypothetical protein
VPLQLLEVADLLEHRHLRQRTRADDGFSWQILGDHCDCLGSLNVDVVPVEDIDGQFEGIAMEAGFNDEFADDCVEEFLDCLFGKGLN